MKLLNKISMFLLVTGLFSCFVACKDSEEVLFTFNPDNSTQPDEPDQPATPVTNYTSPIAVKGGLDEGWTAPKGGWKSTIDPDSRDYGGVGYAASCGYVSSYSSDGWLFAPPFQLTEGVAYEFSFAARYTGSTGTLKIYITPTNDIEEDILTYNPIKTENIYSTYYSIKKVTFTPEKSGKYWFGFYKSSYSGYIYLTGFEVTEYN